MDGTEDRGMMPNPPIQPETDGGNILTAMSWRVGGLMGWINKGIVIEGRCY